VTDHVDGSQGGRFYTPDGPRYFSPRPDMRPDPDMEDLRFLERLEAERVRREAAHERERAAQAERAVRAEEAAALSLMHTDGAAEGYRRFVTAVCERLKIRADIVVTDNCASLAWWPARRIHIRPIVDDGTFAVALHEIGHILAGKCSRREPHRPTIEDGFHLCLACETDAWERAMQLAPFSRAMHDRLKASLMSYKRRITANPSAIAVLDAISNRVGFLRHRQDRVVHEMRHERQRLVVEQLAHERARYLKEKA
jgi:hypothetical protein